MSGHFEDDEDRQVAEPLFMQAQCWICPHCFDDKHHISDEHGCERHAHEGLAGRLLIGSTDV